MPDLVPIRHGRMLTSPFAVLRGSAAMMASDLSTTPASGIRVQACGDCHLLNFGAFGTPERRMNFSINDFDETLPAPWEWDLKRLAASFVVAGRYIDFKEKDSLAAAAAAIRSYRRNVARYAAMPSMSVWYDRLDVEDVLASLPQGVRDLMTARVQKVRARNLAEHDFPKLTHQRNGRLLIKDNPPLLFHLQGNERARYKEDILHALKLYRSSLPDHHRVLLDRFQLYDLAVKVVGVGSVGTECMVALLMASSSDPIFLQVKQANSSVLEPYSGKSVYSNHGQRVVVGQRLMQSASDIMLGWTMGQIRGRHFYIRQLRDMKLSVVVESMTPETMELYARLCGQAVALAHARSGDSAMIAGYLGKSDVFDQAVAKFAALYADQTESDHRAIRSAVRDGRLEATTV